MHPWSSRGLQSGVQKYSLPISSPYYKGSERGRAALINQEIQTMEVKGAVSRVAKEDAHRVFWSVLFLDPKKDGQFRPVIKLMALQQVPTVPPLQNGRDSGGKRLVAKRRLDDTSRFKGCVFHSANSPGESKVPEIV